MDIVPLMTEVEDHFGVTIPDELAWPATVGDLYLYLLARARWPALTPCPTSQAFYRLRRALTAEFEMDRLRVRPSTRLCDLFPAASRDASWPRLAAALCLPDLPELPRRRLPSARAFRIAFTAVTSAWWILYPMLVLATGDAFSLTYGLVIWSLLTLLVGEWYAILWVVYAFDYWERVRIPQVRHLVIRLAVQQADRPEGGGLTPRMVWEDLVALVAAQASVPVQEVHPEQRFGDLPDYC